MCLLPRSTDRGSLANASLPIRNDDSRNQDMNRFGKVSCLVGASVLGWLAGAMIEHVAIDAATNSNQGQPNVEWSQWGGSAGRNNTPVGHNIPTEWEVGDFDYRTGEWDSTNAENIKWVSRLGSQTYGNAVVAGGKVFVGTNNSGGWLPRYPSEVDLGCLIAFDAETGDFLWQHSSEKLPTGRVHDWPLQGICCAALVEGDRLWFVTSRGEVRCLDTEGFHDGENDGEYTHEEQEIKDRKHEYDILQEADVVWSYNMMDRLGVSQHNMCSCSVTAAGDILFVNTSNGQDVEHNYIPAPEAPSFFAMDKNTGKVLWTDNSRRAEHPARSVVIAHIR